jgi:hypothetical protein
VTQVFFGSVLATAFTVSSDGSISATSPVQAAGTVYIYVVAPWGTSGIVQFNYTAASGIPDVSSLSVIMGPTGGGTVVTIYGNGFTNATQVLFGSANATSFILNQDLSITATSPPQPWSTIDVRVVTPLGISASWNGDGFTYMPTAPAVTGVSPASGPTAGGTVVTITGSNFNGTTQVTFGGTAASFTINSATSISAIAPQHVNPGNVDIMVYSPYGNSGISNPDVFNYVSAPAPILQYITPTSGWMAGGTTVTLTGVYFTGASQVFFGSVLASGVTVVSDTRITATAPSQVAGTVDVTVVTPSGVSGLVTPDQFTYIAALPAVSSRSPISGPTSGGTSVMIGGSSFMGATGVFFGSKAAALFIVNSDGSITAVSPVAAAGVVHITVVTPNGTSATSSADLFTYNPASTPAVLSVTANSGPDTGGTTVTITGTNLAGATQVLFGSTPATSFLLLADGTISAVTPFQASGTVDVTVTTGLGISSVVAADQFTYQIALPTVTQLNPNTSTTAGGVTVTITGTNFNGTTAVMFGSVTTYQFSVISNTSINVVVPINRAVPVYVRVTNQDGTSGTGAGASFTYTSTSMTPTVSQVSPGNGPTGGGTSVTITGTNFTGATGVFFGTTAATTFTLVSDTVITATAPAQAHGGADVTVATPNGISALVPADVYTYNTTQPVVTGISPSSGPAGGGTVVTITGTNLYGATAVTFGSNAATSFTLISSTQIIATAPPGTAGGQHITVTTEDGGSSNNTAADLFTYLNVPTVTGINTTSGSSLGGTIVIITGSNFTGLVSVSFGGIPAAALTVNSATQITATTPAGWPGIVDVTVTTPVGVSATSSADQFTFIAPVPTITGLAPNLGPVAGGTSVVITGTNFTGATAVSFGTVAATTFVVNSDSQITVTAPAGLAAGAVDITVTTPAGGTSATAASDLFAYAGSAVRTLTGFTGNTLAANDNDSTGAINLGFGANFFGTTYTQVYINNNGNVTFDGALADNTPYSLLSTIRVIIAPFFADVDTRLGQVVTYGTDVVNGHAAFGVNWIDVGYYNQHVDKLNIVQLVLISRTDVAAGAFDIEFNYGQIIWETGDVSGGKSGFGGTAVHAGYSNGTGNSGTNYEISGSGVGGAFLDTNPVSGLIYNSANNAVLGRYVFPIRTGGGGGGIVSRPRPTITQVAPVSGPASGGTLVTLTGSNFTGVTAVYFGLTRVTNFTISSSTRITVRAPAHAAGRVDIRLVTATANSAITAADQFTYTAAAGAPAPAPAGGPPAPAPAGAASQAGPAAGSQSSTDSNPSPGGIAGALLPVWPFASAVDQQSGAVLFDLDRLSWPVVEAGLVFSLNPENWKVEQTATLQAQLAWGWAERMARDALFADDMAGDRFGVLSAEFPFKEADERFW